MHIKKAHCLFPSIDIVFTSVDRERNMCHLRVDSIEVLPGVVFTEEFAVVAERDDQTEPLSQLFEHLLDMCKRY